MTVCIEGLHEYTAARSHPSGHKVNTDCNPTAKAEPGWLRVCVCVCVVGLALAGKGQGMAQIRSEDEGKENKQKKRKMRRAY